MTTDNCATMNQAVRIPGGRAQSPVVNFLGTLLLWQERASQRRRLVELDGHMLKDLGISRGEAQAEAAKPFWRP